MDTRRYPDRMAPPHREAEESRFSDDREFSRHPSFEGELEYESRERSRNRLRRKSDQVWKEEGAWESVLNFFGIGPKGYQRSNLSLFEDICETLARQPDVDASEIEVEVRSGIVTLKGSVPTRQMKRLAEDCLDGISGILDVQNQLSVISRNTLATESAASLQSTLGKPR